MEPVPVRTFTSNGGPFGLAGAAGLACLVMPVKVTWRAPPAGLADLRVAAATSAEADADAAPLPASPPLFDAAAAGAGDGTGPDLTPSVVAETGSTGTGRLRGEQQPNLLHMVRIRLLACCARGVVFRSESGRNSFW